MSIKKLLVIGGGFLQTFVIKRANELGIYTYVVDANKNAVGFKYANEHAVIDIVDKEACLAYARQNNVDGVMTAATDYGVLTASYIGEKMSLNAINYEAATTVKNKYAVRQALFKAHADDTAQSYEISTEQDMDKALKTVEFPVMVKPCDGSGSRGAAKVLTADEFKAACLDAIACSLSRKAVVESFVVGREYGAESFVFDGEVTVLAVMQKWMTKEPYYAELGHSVPSQLDLKTEQYIKGCVENAIKALNINYGAVNMDLILSPDGKVHIVDIGARMGGNLIGSNIIPTATGVDYMGALVLSAVGEKFDLTPKTEKTCVVTRLLALTPGKVKKLFDIKTAEQKFNVKIYCHLSEGDTISEYHTNLDGCGYIVAADSDYETALKNAEQALCYIDNEIERYE